MRWPVVVALLLGLAVPSLAGAQPGSRDPLPGGYQRLYAGNYDAAFSEFTSARAQSAQALPAWFGQLLSQLARVQVDESLEAGFERDADAFIEAASTRFAQSRADSEALFYLAQAHMVRATFRAGSNQGLWGAARDAARAMSYGEQYLSLIHI